MIKKTFIYLIFIILLIAIGLFVSKKIIKNFASHHQKELMMKYLLPYKKIADQERMIVGEIARLKGIMSQYELDFKNSKKNIQVGKSKNF